MDGKKAKYQALIDWVRERIETKELQPGGKLPSENELSARFLLSRQTVRHAIGILEEEGTVTRIKGSGTYLTDNRQNSLENKTRVAVVTTYVDSYIFPRTIQGIENTLFERGYSVQIAFTDNRVERERTVLEDLLNRDDAAGLIVEATKSALPNPNLDLYRQLMDRKLPVLFINSFYPSLPIPHVSLNDRAAARKAVERLIGAGHRRIGAVLKLDDGQGHLRYAGYIEALRTAGLSVSDSRILWLDTRDISNMELSGERIAGRLRDCTAVLCYNDEVAFRLLPILQAAGRRVPEDLSLVSIDDSQLAQLGDTPLDSIPHPKERLGKKAAENLLRLMKEPLFDAVYEFEEEIVARGSVRPIEQRQLTL